MAHEAKRTVLDAELASLARGVASPDEEDPRTLVLEELAAHATSLEEGPPPKPREKVDLKLVTRSGGAEEAASWVEARGGTVVSAAGRVLVASLPAAAVPELEEASWLRKAEAPRVLHPRLDEARGEPSGLEAALIDHPLTGAGVVVGVIDTGVDWSHPDFQTDAGESRLELFAHARLPEDAEVSLIDEFDRDALNQAIAGSNGVPMGDPNGHGTHVASIAAGNGRALADGRFRGAAPQASLMGVRSEPLLDTHTIWGIRRIFELAGDRPAVINLSLGGHLGPHDGTTAIENVIAQESGPGRIVVVAAGNEGGDGIHWQGDLVEGEDLVIETRIAGSGLQFVDLWVPRGDQLEVFIETPDGFQAEPDGTVVETPSGFFLAEWREDSVNRDQNLNLRIAGATANEVWRVRLRPQTVLQGRVHAWAGTADPSTSRFLFPGQLDPAFSIGMPATEERCLAIASLVSRTHFETAGGQLGDPNLTVGQLSEFSSHGPTRYGALKPDIAAPGQFVTAALSSGSELETVPRSIQRHHPDGPYISIQGTSMATPFVVGVIALMLEREPTLTPEEIQQRMRITARRDSDTGRVWGSGFGFGKLDVEALLGYEG